MIMMSREQAIFFETMDDLNFEGYTELLIMAYHDFLSGFDLSKVTDLEVHNRAKEFIKKYQQYWYSDVDFDKIRRGILEKLDFEKADLRDSSEKILVSGEIQ